MREVVLVPSENVVPKSRWRSRGRALVKAHADNIMLLVGTALVFWGFVWKGLNIGLIGAGSIVIVLEIVWTAKEAQGNGR